MRTAFRGIDRIRSAAWMVPGVVRLAPIALMACGLAEPYSTSLAEAWFMPVREIPGQTGAAQVRSIAVLPPGDDALDVRFAVAMNQSNAELGAVAFYAAAPNGFAHVDELLLVGDDTSGIKDISTDDLDGDGVWDLTLAQELGEHQYGEDTKPNRLAILYRSETGFQAISEVAELHTSQVETADLTGDGAVDVAAVVENELLVWANDGHATFRLLDGGPREVMDITAGIAGSGSAVLLSAHLYDGLAGYEADDRAWSTAFAFQPVGTAVLRGFVATDADLDGDMDVALNLGQGGFELWVNDGGGMEKRWDLAGDRCFHAGRGLANTESASRVCALAAVDLDGDGYEDLVSVDGNGLTVLANRGGREYDIVQTVPGTWSVLDTGDVDRDGDPDVVAGGIFDLTVFLNEASAPP